METFDPSRLKQFRLSAQYKQSDVAKKLSLDPSAISNYEKGKRKPDIETLQRLAKLYGVNVSDLLGEVNNAKHAMIIQKEKIPYFAPNNPFTIMFSVMFLISINMLGVLTSPYTVLLFFFVIVMVLSVHSYYFFIGGTKTYDQFKVRSNQALLRTHEDDEKTLKKWRYKELGMLTYMLFLLFIIHGAFLTEAQAIEAADAVVMSGVVAIAFIYVFILIFFAIVKPTFVKEAPDSHFNHSLNTLRYNSLKVASVVLYIWHLIVFGVYHLAFDEFYLKVVFFLIIQAAFFIPYITAHHRLKLAQAYKPTIR